VYLTCLLSLPASGQRFSWKDGPLGSTGYTTVPQWLASSQFQHPLLPRCGTAGLLLLLRDYKSILGSILVMF